MAKKKQNNYHQVLGEVKLPVKIILKIKGKDVEFTLDELKTLKTTIETVLGNQRDYYPIYPDYPTCPYHPSNSSHTWVDITYTSTADTPYKVYYG